MEVDLLPILGSNSSIGSGVIFGPGQSGIRAQPIIGNNSLLRRGTIVYGDVEIGHHFICGHNVLIREKCFIGDHVLIGTNSVLDNNVTIENFVKIEKLEEELERCKITIQVCLRFFINKI